MKVVSLKMFFIVGVVAIGAVVFWPAQQGESCSQTSDAKAKEFVKNDFLQRMTRWEDDAKFLGTRTPAITWGKIERMSTENEEVLNIPFQAKGPDATKEYFGMYQCKKGFVEYATK